VVSLLSAGCTQVRHTTDFIASSCQSLFCSAYLHRSSQKPPVPLVPVCLHLICNVTICLLPCYVQSFCQPLPHVFLLLVLFYMSWLACTTCADCFRFTFCYCAFHTGLVMLSEASQQASQASTAMFGQTPCLPTCCCIFLLSFSTQGWCC
jgi:hypothetical protein